VRPTAAASQVAARATEALGALERAVGEMAEGTRGRLGLGSFPTASEVFMVGALARFQRRLPGVEVVFVDGEPSDLVPGLLAGDLDVVVSFRYDGVPQVWPPAVQRTELVVEPVALLVPQRAPVETPPGAAVAPSDFSDVPWIATQEGTAGARAVERACADAGSVPPVRYRTNDDDVVRSFVRAGLGEAAAPWLAHAGRADLSVVQPAGLAVRRRVEALTARRPPPRGRGDGLRAARCRGRSEPSPTTDGLGAGQAVRGLARTITGLRPSSHLDRHTTLEVPELRGDPPCPTPLPSSTSGDPRGWWWWSPTAAPACAGCWSSTTPPVGPARAAPG